MNKVTNKKVQVVRIKLQIVDLSKWDTSLSYWGMNYNIEEKKPIACEKICLAPGFQYLL